MTGGNNYNMDTKELLSKIGITKSGEQSADNSYVIDIDTYEEYGKFYSLLEKAEENELLNQLDDQSVINVHTTDLAYLYEGDEGDDSYEISLLGDLDQDIYKLVVDKF